MSLHLAGADGPPDPGAPAAFLQLVTGPPTADVPPLPERILAHLSHDRPTPHRSLRAALRVRDHSHSNALAILKPLGACPAPLAAGALLAPSSRFPPPLSLRTGNGKHRRVRPVSERWSISGNSTPSAPQQSENSVVKLREKRHRRVLPGLMCGAQIGEDHPTGSMFLETYRGESRSPPSRTRYTHGHRYDRFRAGPPWTREP